MDPESKKLLEKTYELVEENHQMLRKIRRVQNRAAFFSLVKTLLILGISIGAFYYLQPYVDSMQNFIEETGMTIDKFKSLLPK